MLPQPIVDALSKASNDKLLKVLIIDANGNVVSGDLTKLANALQSVGTDKLLAVLSEDDVGVAKDATLNKIVNALQSVGTDKLLIDISQDDVGIAKDVTLAGIKEQTDKIVFDDVANLVTNREDSLASFRGDLSIPDGVFYQIPSLQEVIVKDFAYAGGDLYVEGILEVV